MRAHSLTIEYSKLVRPAKFHFERWWMINDVKKMELVIAELKRRTYNDGVGRVLAIGSPAKNRDDQNRLFIVKKGHDGYLWFDTTPLGKEALQKIEK